MMKFFEKNVGDMDRAVRIISSFALVGIGVFLLTPPLTYVAFLLAVVMVFTGATKSCALYTLVGMSTVGKKPEAKRKK
jgi:hypothetical protein